MVDKPDPDDVAPARDETSPPARQAWEKPTVDRVDARLAKHGNCGGVDGMFSSS